MSDDELVRRLAALRSEGTPGAATDAELLARSRELRGQPGATALAAPQSGWLPPSKPAGPSVPHSAADAKLGGLMDAFVGGGAGAAGADDLLQQAADMVRLEGAVPGASHGDRVAQWLQARGEGGRAELDDASLAALAGGACLDCGPLAAPTRAELAGMKAEARSTLGEAQGAMPKGEAKGAAVGAAGAAGPPGGRGLVDGFPVDDFDEGDEEDEAAEAERLLAEMQDELDFEEKYGGGGGAPALPAAPTTAPKPAPSAAAAVSLFPAAPSHAARNAKPPPPPPPPPPKPDETERWCIICNEDAALWCAGCDGDPYCKRCWREGHVGQDASFSGHQTVPISQPRP